MSQVSRRLSIRHSVPIGALVLSALAGVFAPSLAWAHQPEADAAIGRAEGRIDIATRQAGAGGYGGDQNYDVARTRLDEARKALKDGRYDAAQMLADEASVLAELTVEKAKLAALQISHDLVVKTANLSNNPQ